jgi:hypothetical protein
MPLFGLFCTKSTASLSIRSTFYSGPFELCGRIFVKLATLLVHDADKRADDIAVLPFLSTIFRPYIQKRFSALPYKCMQNHKIVYNNKNAKVAYEEEVYYIVRKI